MSENEIWRLVRLAFDRIDEERAESVELPESLSVENMLRRIAAGSARPDSEDGGDPVLRGRASQADADG